MALSLPQALTNLGHKGVCWGLRDEYHKGSIAGHFIHVMVVVVVVLVVLLLVFFFFLQTFVPLGLGLCALAPLERPSTPNSPWGTLTLNRPASRVDVQEPIPAPSAHQPVYRAPSRGGKQWASLWGGSGMWPCDGGCGMCPGGRRGLAGPGAVARTHRRRAAVRRSGGVCELDPRHPQARGLIVDSSVAKPRLSPLVTPGKHRLCAHSTAHGLAIPPTPLANGEGSCPPPCGPDTEQ